MIKLSNQIYGEHFVPLTDVPILLLLLNDVDGGLFVIDIPKFYIL